MYRDKNQQGSPASGDAECVSISPVKWLYNGGTEVTDIFEERINFGLIDIVSSTATSGSTGVAPLSMGPIIASYGKSDRVVLSGRIVEKTWGK